MNNQNNLEQHSGKVSLMNDNFGELQNIEVNSELLVNVDFRQFQQKEKTLSRPISFFRGVLKRFFKNKWAVVFLIIFIVICLMALIIPLTSPYPSFYPILSNTNPQLIRMLPPRLIGMDPIYTYPEPISSDIYEAVKQLDDAGEGIRGNIIVSAIQQEGNPNFYWLTLYPYRIPALSNLYPVIGTDTTGIDMWTKVWDGFAGSLGTGIIVSVFAIIIGSIYGAIAGSFAGKTIDIVMMRIIDIIGSVPSVVLLIVLSLVIASSNPDASATLDNTSITFSLILISWMGPAYLVRMYIIRNRNAEYIQTVRVIGGSKSRILFFHLLPNISGRIFVRFVHMIPGVIFFETSLIIIGLRTPTSNSFGQIFTDTYGTNLAQMVYAPIAIFALFAVSTQIIANAMNDAVDPRIIGK